MKNRLASLQRRIATLESANPGDVIFFLHGGSRATIPEKRLLDGLLDVIGKRDTPGARIMLQAKRASDDSQLHFLAQALRAGPVPPGQVNDDNNAE
jgi:hypothetical protein